MVPAERSLVDLSESKTTTLIGVLNVGEVVVEVVEGIVTTTGLVGRDDRGWNWSSHCVYVVLPSVGNN
jgi:hypothetical protein